MADLDDRLARLSPAQRTRLQERLVARAAARLRAAAEPGADAAPAEPVREVTPGEPIAIVGMACRFAGAPNLDAFWRMIRDGVEGVTDVPPERWDVDDFYDPAGGPGKSVTRRGAFLDGIDQFEPAFFGVTPREAGRMDPQQRLLLEVAWEACENAGWPADRLAGTATGVYVGVGGTDYKQAPIFQPDYFEMIDAHVGTGNALSIASNRISYALDLRGPSLSVDTACSSGSLAIHLAIESLRRGESDFALAGGVNAILTPEVTIAFSQSHMLSPEGRCRSYDESAAGYVRGEGCALVLLKRLADAQRDGDDVLAVLLGSAVNQDGRTPGIAAPSKQQQQACLRAAMADAGVTPDDIDYVEGHGTGTPLGDPVELQALAEVFRTTHADPPPLWLASVKAHIGHTETVSGVAGLIKTVLMLRHGVAPRQLHLERLNPHADLTGSRVTPLTAAVDWPSRLAAGGPRRVAGVSSFGFGGTNTHLVVAEAPPRRAPRAGLPEPSAHVVKLAAKTPDRIVDQARLLAAWLRSDGGRDAPLADVAYSATTGRADFAHRVAIVAADRDTLLRELDAVARGDSARQAADPRERPTACWLFTGQGAQRVGMGRELYRAEPVFRRVVDRCEDALADTLPTPLTEVLYASEADDPRVHETRYAQPALFAVECGLAALWRSWGFAPDVVLGHSIGEFAALVSAGVLTLEDGARLVGQRGRLMHAAPGRGAMGVVFADAAAVEPVVARRSDVLAIAALNGPRNTVLSGEAAALAAALEELKHAGIDSKRLVVSHAFHSPLMETVLEEFESFARSIPCRVPRVPIASNVSGRLIGPDDTPADWPRYWRDQLRGTVRFAEGVAAVAEARAALCVEVGPAPVLCGMAAQCGADFVTGPAWVPSLRPDRDDSAALAEAVAAVWAAGAPIDWRALHRGRPRRRLPLPNYPLRRERFWYESLQTRGARRVERAGADQSPELGGRVPAATAGDLFEAPLDLQTPAWLVDHRVGGAPVAPAAMFVEQALAAAAALGSDYPLRIDDLTIRQALAPQGAARLRVQTHVERESSGRRRVSIHSAPADEDAPAWTLHAEAAIVASPGDTPPRPTELDGFATREIDRLGRDAFYAAIRERGLEYGPAFRVLDDVRRSEFDAVADLAPHRSVAAEASRRRLHPALGDAVLQTVAATLPLGPDGSYCRATYLPARVDSVRLHRPIEPGEPLRAYAVRRFPAAGFTGPPTDHVEADALLLDASDRPVVSLLGVRVQRLAESRGPRTTSPADWLYRVVWSPLEGTDARSDWPKGPTLVLADTAGVGERLAHEIVAHGGACLVANAAEGFTVRAVSESLSTATLDPTAPKGFDRLVELIAANPALAPAAVVAAWGLDAADDWDAAERVGVGAAMRVVQALARRGVSPSLGLTLVTRAASRVGVLGESPASPPQAAIVGLARVAALEHGELRVRSIDLGPDDALSIEDLLAAPDESELALRGGRRYTPRLERADALAAAVAEASGGTPVPDAASWRLALGRPGSFDSLAYEPCERHAPDAGQIEIKVSAAALNFSDVLKALGLYPGMRDAVTPLGIEAAGVVTAVGAGVDGLRIGDAALAVAPYAFASHTTTAAYAATKVPAGMSLEDAAALPIVFLTAHHALVRLARLSAGERVLIHAGAGGVGLAAIQIARAAGAEVFATAGSDSKRDFLHGLGVEHVFDSRSLDFARGVRDATRGEGVDVVLNSLPGEAIAASLGLLRAYGRFCEIGKIDIYQDRKIGLLPFQDNLSYFAIDLDRLLRERPEEVRSLMAEVMERFAAGVYTAPPHTVFATHETADAFRYMSQRKNIGKVVVSMVPRDARATRDSAIADTGVLITGGFGALGRLVARRIVAAGAGGVALVGRGEPDAEFLAELESQGAVAVGLAADVSDAAALRAALDTLPEGFPPITALYHAAGVLDDGLLRDLDAERLARVLRPKARGAWNLHGLTLEAGSRLAGVERMVLFSSAAATLGSPGQANYAAANAALDALAERRRAAGLPATSVAWGPWAGAGMAAGQTAESLRARGFEPLAADAALGLLDRIIAADAGTVAAIDARWDALSRVLGGRRPPMFAAWLGTKGADRGDADLRSRLSALSPAERQAELVALVRGELARVTRTPAESIDPSAPLTSIGIDSLMALELKNNLEAKLAIVLPMGKLLAGPTVATLAEAAAEELVGAAAGRVPRGWEPLVQLTDAPGDAPAVFLTPVLGGDVAAYRELSDALAGKAAVYAIRSRGLDTDDPPHADMAGIARDYAAAIRAARPGGPYRLAGWSTGGVVALAVAERLEADGARVERVTLLDTPPGSVYEGVDTNDHAAFLYGVAMFIARFTAAGEIDLTAASLAALPERDRLAAVGASLRRTGVVGTVEPAFLERLVRVGEALVVATKGFRPGDLRAGVEFVSPEVAGGLDGVTTLPASNAAAWRSVYGGRLAERTVAGDHFTMMRGAGAAAIAEGLLG